MREKRESGVGFAIRSSLIEQFEDLPHGFSDRLMSCCLGLTNDRYATIISASYQQEIIDQFYSDLSSIVSKTHVDDKLVILGDYNARIG